MIFIRYDLENRPEVAFQDGGLQVSLFDPALGSVSPCQPTVSS